jgi:drug/metabolite transporter (DMT)-like permease
MYHTGFTGCFRLVAKRRQPHGTGVGRACFFVPGHLARPQMKSTLNNSASTAIFVCIWGSGAIFTEWGLQHASALMFLVLRFTIALAVLTVIGIYRRRWLPRSGTRLRIVTTGLLLTGGYSICYFLALEHGVTPGVLATLLGVQPILTLLFFERQLSPLRIAGLGFALAGLILVVHQSIDMARSSIAGTCFGLGALVCITTGAILQKGVTEPVTEVLPLQYSMSLILCTAVLPFEPLTLSFNLGFLVPLLWLGLIVSVVAQLLFYRLLRSGNLVNVTSLFYLVPIVTAALDYLFFGHRLEPLSLAGMGSILLGLWLVFLRAKGQPAAKRGTYKLPEPSD